MVKQNCVYSVLLLEQDQRRKKGDLQRLSLVWSFLFGVGLLLTLTQCKPRRPDSEQVREHIIFANDFDQLVNWLPSPDPSITDERAHSGRYAVKVDKDNTYSITYRLTIGEVCKKRPRRLRISAWTWVDGEEDDARIVFILNPPNATPGVPPLYSTQLYLANKWPYKRWTYVSRDIDLPPEISSQTQFVVFLWHCAAKHRVFADDWKLTEIR